MNLLQKLLGEYKHGENAFYFWNCCVASCSERNVVDAQLLHWYSLVN